MLKFVVISDLHIVPERQLSHAVDTAERLALAVSHINQLHPDAEFCIAAGDLTDHGETAAYRRLKRSLGGLNLPFYLTLGNHDDRQNYRREFDDAIVADTGYADICIDKLGHRILVLDSLDSGRHPGLVDAQQLDWLAARLREASDRPVIVVLHHNICDLQVSTDSIRLRENRGFADVLAEHPDIRHVISGHVHLSSSGVYRGIPFTTFAGSHYNIDPRRDEPNLRAPRRAGPGQCAVVWSDEEATVVLQEDFFSCHQKMPPELFY